MGLLDSLASSALGAVMENMGLAQGQAGGLAQATLSALQNQPGGLGGLVQAFEQQGLGNIIASWVSTGQNLPISADQLKQVLGGHVGAIAQQAGVSPDQGLSALTQLLPQLIDQLTPNGQVPQGGGDLLQAGLELIKKFS